MQNLPSNVSHKPLNTLESSVFGCQVVILNSDGACIDICTSTNPAYIGQTCTHTCIYAALANPLNAYYK